MWSTGTIPAVIDRAGRRRATTRPPAATPAGEAGRAPAVAVVVALLALVAGVAAFRSTRSPGHEVVSFPAPRSGPVEGVEPEVRTETDAGELRSAPERAPSTFEDLSQRPGTVYATDFATLDPDWDVYDSPGHAGRGLRRPSAVTVGADPEAEGSSVLRITARMGEGSEAGELVSGGLALDRPRTYGTYTFRMRVDADPDEGTSGVALLWPESNRWPQDGELDMVETWANRATRAPVESNIHWLSPDAVAPFDDGDDRLLSVRYEGVDATEWHTYRFDWRARRLTMSIDGGPARALTVDPTRIPHWDMVPTFQLDAFPAPDAPDQDPVLSGEVTLEVDWLVIEE